MATTADALQAMRAAKTSVPQVIRRLMRFYGITAADLAPVLGVSGPAVYARLAGTTVVKSEEIAALAVFFGVPVRVFFLPPDEAVKVAALEGTGGPSPQSRCTDARAA